MTTKERTELNYATRLLALEERVKDLKGEVNLETVYNIVLSAYSIARTKITNETVRHHIAKGLGEVSET